MGLLKDLETGKMSVQSLNGKTPTSYNSTNPDGAKTVSELKENAGLDPVSLKDSNLDLNGHTPPRYVDNLPE